MTRFKDDDPAYRRRMGIGSEEIILDALYACQECMGHGYSMSMRSRDNRQFKDECSKCDGAGFTDKVHRCKKRKGHQGNCSSGVELKGLAAETAAQCLKTIDRWQPSPGAGDK